MSKVLVGDGGWTLEDAREWLREQFESGAQCPCCKQHVKLWRRSIHGQMAKALCVMDQKTREGEFVKMLDVLKPYRDQLGVKVWGGDIVKLRYWGFLEAKKNEVRDDGSDRAGIWRITPTGRAFARNEIDAPKYRYVYNGEVVPRKNADIERVWIVDCLGEKFDYTKLRNGTPDGSSPYPKPI